MDEKKIRHGNTQENKESSSGHGGKMPWITTIAFVIVAAVAVVTVISNTKNSARINEAADNGSSSGEAPYAETTSTATISAPPSPTYTFEPTDFPSPTPENTPVPEQETVSFPLSTGENLVVNLYNADQGNLAMDYIVRTVGCRTGLGDTDRFIFEPKFDEIYSHKFVAIPGFSKIAFGYVTFKGIDNGVEVSCRLLIVGVDPDINGIPQAAIVWLKPESNTENPLDVVLIRDTFDNVIRNASSMSGWTENTDPSAYKLTESSN